MNLISLTALEDTSTRLHFDLSTLHSRQNIASQLTDFRVIDLN